MNTNYSPRALKIAVHQERAKLLEELRKHTRRIREIELRLEELEKADNLLDGELDG